MADERLYALAYASFGGLATLRAAVGRFGLTSYNVTGTATMLQAATALLAAAALAVYLPVRRGARIDPLVALQDD